MAATTSSSLLAILFLCVFIFAGWVHTAAVGNSFISGDHHLQPTEVKSQCCVRGFSCCKTITEMDKVIYKNFTKCIEDETPKENLGCPVKKNARKLARDDYCYFLHIIDKEFVENILPALIATNSCVSHPINDTKLRNSSHFVQTLIDWHKEMRQTHTTKNCCFKPYNSTKSESQLITENIIRRNSSVKSLSEAKKEQTKLCDKKWNEILPKVARNMNVVEKLEKLGRRRSCLRGCVNQETVKCVEFLML